MSGIVQPISQNQKRQGRSIIYGKIPGLILITILSIVIPFENIQCQSYGGGYAESYLLRDVGARPLGMGGAYTAIINEPGAIFYNPAGLSFLTDEPMVTTMYSFLEYGRKHASMAWGQTILDNLGVGVGINSFNSGSFVGRDIRGNSLGNMSDWAYAISAAAAYRIEFASVGATVKYLTNNLIGTNTCGSGYAVDLGMKFNVADLFSFGLAVNNVSGMMFWNNPGEDNEALPFTVRAGLAMEYGLNEDEYTTRSTVSGELETIYVPATRYILVGLDWVITQHEQAPRLILGTEAVLHEMIAFRAGLSLYGEKMGQPMLLPMNGWGAGVSLRPDLKDLPFMTHIDYTISSDYISQSGISHHVSLMFEF